MVLYLGIDGLINGDVKPIGWTDVSGWVAQGRLMNEKLFLQANLLIFTISIIKVVPFWVQEEHYRMIKIKWKQ